MIKHEIPVPKGKSHVNEIEDFELPNGILNKQVPNCGATTLALEDKHKTIICSPRNNLIENKHEQYKNTLLVVGGCNKSKIREYMENEEIPKILTSYDSFSKVADCIDDKSDWRVVVDEFQYLLADSNFKSETEVKFMENLKQFGYVTYLSATPILDRFIERIDYFKDIPYYQMIWQDVEKIKVIRRCTSRPLEAALEIVSNYKNGIYPNMEVNGSIVYSKECVIFLNSVENILNIIRKTDLSADEVNIIVGNSSDNDSMIAKLGDGFARGRIPLKGEPHRKFTFCTSTAFAGCDFYSTNATSFVISDGKRMNTTIDIATDLVQIAGRQRLAENPFRKYLVFVYNKSTLKLSKEDFVKDLQKRKELTYAEIEMKNSVTNPKMKEKLIRDHILLQKMLKFKETFTMYDSVKGEFIFNKMALWSECYFYQLQKYNYENGIIIRNQLIKSNFDVSTNQQYVEYEKQLEHLIKRESFADRMKKYCDYKESNNPFEALTATLEKKYPELKLFYDELGGERIKALGYKENELQNEIKWKNIRNRLRNEFISLFSKHSLSAEKVKFAMNEVYAKLGVNKKGKVSDLSNVYGLKVTRHKVTVGNGKREYVYEIE